jgi:hypothetical protein
MTNTLPEVIIHYIKSFGKMRYLDFGDYEYVEYDKTTDILHYGVIRHIDAVAYDYCKYGFLSTVNTSTEEQQCILNDTFWVRFEHDLCSMESKHTKTIDYILSKHSYLGKTRDNYIQSFYSQNKKSIRAKIAKMRYEQYLFNPRVSYNASVDLNFNEDEGSTIVSICSYLYSSKYFKRFRSIKNCNNHLSARFVTSQYVRRFKYTNGKLYYRSLLDNYVYDEHVNISGIWNEKRRKIIFYR